MGLITGLYCPTGAPVDLSLAHSMNAKGVLFTRAYSNLFSRPHVALATRQFCATPESPGEVQPVSDATGNRWIVLDGRVDNREELVRVLDLQHRPAERWTDAALVLAAYDAWGLECARRIIGDFAWVIWDGAREHLFCARDPVGTRPLFYTCAGETFAWGSQLDQVLLASPSRSEELSESFVADYFVAGKSVPGATPYDAVKSLPAGHRLVVSREGLRLDAYWDLEDQPKIIYRDPREYVEHFLELFRNAVRAHLRSDGPVWSDLSGGLDSSSVVSVAAQELSGTRSSGDGTFATMSVVFDGARESDEREWAGHIVERYRLRNHQVSGDRYHPFGGMLEGAGWWDLPSMEVFSSAFHRHLVGMLTGHGVRTVLKGLGAECVVLGEAVPPIHLADLLRRGHLRRFGRELSTWQKSLNRPLGTILYTHGLKPLLQPRTVTVRPHTMPDWVAGAFAKRTRLRERADHAWMPRRFRSAADQWQYEQIRRLPGALHPGCLHKAVDVRLPFLHRPLLEFAMRVPWEHKVRPGTNKILLREAMRGILPEPVRTRTRLVTGNAAMYAGVQKEWPDIRSMLDSSLLVSLGYVDGAAWERGLRLARHGASPFLAGVLRPLALEVWLRARVSTPQRAAA